MTSREIQDQKVISGLSTAVTKEREAISEVVRYLAQVDERKVYLKQAFSSLFQYCVEKLHYSESAAYRRIHAARMSKKFPQILGLLKEGKVHLTTITLIAPHVISENVDHVLSHVTHKTKREVEKILATMFPTTQTVPDQIRRLPSSAVLIRHPEAQRVEGSRVDTTGYHALAILAANRSQGLASHPARPCWKLSTGFFGSSSLRSESPQNDEARFRHDAVLPMTDAQVKVTFQATTTFANNLNRAKEILKHKHPQGRIEDVLGEALECFLAHKDPMRKAPVALAKVAASKSGSSRYIPQATRTAVWQRDNGRCTYCSPDGKRCMERGGLDLDHINPFALGGTHDVKNLRLLCRSHNLWRAQQTFG